jgi:hypothetical protein
MIYKIKNFKINGILSSETVDWGHFMRHAKTATLSMCIREREIEAL